MDSSTSHHAIQKRARQQLSCTVCRTGKLKCNRLQPCDQCIKRSKESSCQYLAPPQKKRKIRNARDRVAHLEGLVAQLIAQNGQGDAGEPVSIQTEAPNDKEHGRQSSATRQKPMVSKGQSDASQVKPLTPPSDHTSPEDLNDGSVTPSLIKDSADVLHAVGALQISHGVTSYVGATHWKALLEQIEELKADLEDDEDADEESPENQPVAASVYDHSVPLSTPNLEFASAEKGYSRESLFACVPPKPLADRYVRQYFMSPDPGLAIFHKPTFQAEYAKFWESPSDVSLMWLGMLFGVFCLGKRIGLMTNASPGDFEDAIYTPEDFQRLAAASISLADYTKPRRYTLEAMLVYAGCEYVVSARDGGIRLWLFLSTVCRIALYMGYHRDPDHYPKISPFEGEMRRRIWEQCRILDVLSSFQLGLPSLILNTASDTRPASNLLDMDFGPQMRILPPSRPMSELTPITYAIVKARLVRVFAQAMEVSHAVTPPTLATTMEIDRKLEETRREMPEQLLPSAIDNSIVDIPAVIYHRFKLELLYQKTRCTLHRRWLTDANTDPEFDGCRERCVDAAMRLLETQETIERMTADDGPLRNSRWFLVALGTQDLLGAAMLICLKATFLSRAHATSPQDLSSSSANAEITKIRDRLVASHRIFSSIVGIDPKALRAMAAMVSRIEKVMGKTPVSMPTESSTFASSDDISATFTIEDDSVPQGDTNDSNMDAFSMDTDFFGSLDNIEGMFNTQTNLDWGNWNNSLETLPGGLLAPAPFDPFSFGKVTTPMPFSQDFMFDTELK